MATRRSSSPGRGKPANRKSPTRKAPVRRPSNKKPGNKKPGTKKPATKKPVGRKTVGKKAPGKKIVSRKAPGKKALGKKVVSRKAPGKKALGKKIVSRRAPGKKAPGKKAPSKKVISRKAPAKTAGKKTTKRTVRKSSPRRLLKVTPAKSDAASDGKIRLNRHLASAGICSRRAADELIESGRITVNGEVVAELGYRITPSVDDVRFDEQPVVPEKSVYVLFNKPKDVVCTNSTREARRRVLDFMPDVRGRIYTVGRLDADSEGLILLTNDGDFAQTVAHPSHGVPKTYSVVIRGRLEPDAAAKARGGVWLSEGKTGGAELRVQRTTRDRTYLKVVLREGKNREIRRVFARLGHSVISLKRIRIGALSLHGLRPGAHRFLRPDEVRDLTRLAEDAS